MNQHEPELNYEDLLQEVQLVLLRLELDSDFSSQLNDRIEYVFDLFHVEHSFYRPNLTNNTLTSAGVTPLTLLA